MDQEKIGNFLKKIRKDNNLTQEQFANILGVTPQAVSKWENAKNIPDIGILKRIKELYNLDLDEILDGENNKKKPSKIHFVIVFLSILIVVLLVLIILPKREEGFVFEQIGTTCTDFKIAGTVAYNSSKTALTISKIEYCGSVNEEVYSEIECHLYEVNQNKESEIASCGDEKNIKLEDFLHKVTINIEHYTDSCKMFSDANMYLLINAKSSDNRVTTYEIPIVLGEKCATQP